MSKEFDEVKNDVGEGKEPTTTVRELLRWFGARRRRTGIVKKIQLELDGAGIVTSPDFTKVWIDAEIAFKKAPEPVAIVPPPQDPQGAADTTYSPKDANFLISMLKAANCGVVAVKPQDTIEKAITLMLAHDFSQLAVMPNDRTISGAISWKTIGKRLSQENNLVEVKDAMEAAVALEDTEGLFKATKLIIDHEFVFVRSSLDKKVTGIVTATDLSEQFQFLSEPFLLIGQIENQIRNLINGKYAIEVLQSVCSDADPERKERIQSVADLTFGEYLWIIQNPEHWEKLELRVDRVVFCAEMDKVREIRNDVMHFDPDGIDEEQYDQLRRFSRLMDELEALSQ
ncbi:CBS domain-containing protein [Stappia sp. 28M-7]|uniref:CBS domain-containing protein n=1 Tax=Stappia sp. 28M-7 TaxID=2762596 RepID=UPI00163CFEED|nr:CBS domain-containing protein [Stappia sp. 28M-7]MBC2859861.1 CBS domain-containing protein [Stappia sp. 28M-7]